jgi:hypothetical protein
MIGIAIASAGVDLDQVTGSSVPDQPMSSHRVVWPDGSVHWVEGLGQVTVDGSGEPTGTIGCTRDVTAYALVEQALSVAAENARQSAARAELLSR